jgi:iron complex outermembrane receptor protein
MAIIPAAPKLRLMAAAAPMGLIAMMLASPAFAQGAAGVPQAPAAQSDPVPADGDTGQQGDIVVTGTLFHNATTTASPVTVLTTETIDRAGITTISDAIRSVSADSAGSIGTGFQSGFSAGGSAISLRGAGVSSTTILIDGLRSANFPLNDDGHNAYVDLNSIPMANLQSVQVLKDGASSLYGADAIGGVVNIITRKHINGIEGNAEGGAAEKGDAQKYRAVLRAGIGDYDRQGWNFYVTGEYDYSGRVTSASRGFPFDTQDLTAIGGKDNNRADDSLTSATTDAIVTRVGQTDLNNPLSGTPTLLSSNPAQFQTLTALSNCAFGTFTVSTTGAGSQQGTACKHDLSREYRQVLPLQERYGFTSRLSIRLGDSVEGYIAGSYFNSRVDIIAPPTGIRQTQPFGAPAAQATSSPGIVLPVWICPSGVNCADPATAGRTLNPNNPYAAAFANDPASGAARIYYLFGDLKSGSARTNEVYRGTAGLNGSFSGGWNWRVDASYSRDVLSLTDYGWFQTAALVKAINTGSYNFVNPSANSQAVRDAIAPPVHTDSFSTEATLDASLSKTLITLPGGDLNLALGGQVRRETLENNSRNPALDHPGLNTSQAYGSRTVAAAFFEVDAPILDSLDVNLSGRYDHYSEGYKKFSPKIGVKFSPLREFALRGTYSRGFRAPTFAESNPRSSYAGFSNFTPSAAFIALHPGNAAYTTLYGLGNGSTGNPDVKPEKSRSFTAGAIFQPRRWLTVTADYFNIKKSDLIVAGPLVGQARTAYYSVAGQTFASAAAAAAAGCAAVAAVGPGYSCNAIDSIDPFNPNALPRVLIINTPYVNAAYEVISGLDFSVSAEIPLTAGVRWITRAEATDTLQFNLHTGSSVQKYAGTLGPQELSSGNGTPRWRGNWQNTLDFGNFSLSTTTYFVGRIKEVAADEVSSSTPLDCANALYKAPSTPANQGDEFCHVHSFIYTDVNARLQVNDQFSFYVNVGNALNARAPIAPAGYASSPNYLTSWHTPGLIGRTFRAGANFKF